jgi:preprotein translocase subunit SecF
MNAIRRAYRGENDFDFPKWSTRALVVSLLLVVVSVVSLATQQLELSLDFEGGSSWAVPSEDFDADDAGEVLAEFENTADARFQEATTAEGERVLRITSGVEDIDDATRVSTALAEAAGVDDGEVTATTIGPSWGADITRQAARSLILFTILVTAYLAWRLEPKMALGAMAAVVHDLVLTVGFYSVFQIEVTPATVIAFLTILGYSLYDTVIVFDRVKESVGRNARTGQNTYSAIMRRSLNEVLMRSINTSVTTVLPVVSMLVVGGFVFDEPLLSDFSVALGIGLVLGVYSSMFVAAPVTTLLKEREPRFKEIRARMQSRGMDPDDTRWRAAPGAPANAGAGAAAASASTGAPSKASPAAGGGRPGSAPPLGVNIGGHPPRPRKSRPKR